MSLLSPAQEKQLADLLAKAFAQPAPAEKGPNSIRVRTGYGVSEFPVRPNTQIKERDIA